jgi:hypothetical protein
MVSNRTPPIRQHKTRQRVYVYLNGKQHYLGKAGDWPPGRKHPPACIRAEYEALIARWLAQGRRLPKDQEDGPTVNEVVLAYDKFAEGNYKPGGTTTTGELRCTRDALRPLKQLYGNSPAADFGHGLSILSAKG